MAEVNFLVKKGLTVPKGSASTPSIIFDAGDANTGIYSPGADQLALATNGTGRLFVDSSGNVGIATSTPNAALEVNGTIRSGTGSGASLAAGSIDVGKDIGLADGQGIVLGSARRIAISSTGTTTLNAAAATVPFIANIGASEVARIDSSGRLGIGTSSPSGLFDARGFSYLSGAQIRDSSHVAKGYVQGDARGFLLATDGSTNIVFDVNGTERARIDTSGRLGIGTTSPSASSLLDVSSTTQGFLPPRMTGAQRDAISSPAAGLMVYNTTTNKLNFYNGSAWEAVTSA